MQNPHVPSVSGAAAMTAQPMPPPSVTRVRIPTRVQPHSRIAPEAGAQAASTVAAGSNIPVAAASIAASSSVSSSRSASSATPTPPPTAPPTMAREISAQSAASAAAVALTPTPTPTAVAEEFPPPPSVSPTRYVAVTPDPPLLPAAAPSPAPDPPAPIAPPSAAASSASNPIGVSSDEEDEMGDVDDDEALSTAPDTAAAATSESLDRCFCSDPHALLNDLVCSHYDERPWMLQGGVKCYTTHARCVRTPDGLPFRDYVMGTSSFLCQACITRPGFRPPAGYRCTYRSEAGHFYNPLLPGEMQQMEEQQQEMETDSAEAAATAAAAAAAAAMPSTPPRPPPSVARSTTDNPLPPPLPPAPRAPSSAAAASVASSSAASKFGSGALIDLSGDADEILAPTPANAATSKPVRVKKSSSAAAVVSAPFAPVTLPYKLRHLVLRLDGALVAWPRRLDAHHTEDDATAALRVIPYKPLGPRSSRIRDRKERESVWQAQRELEESMEGGGGGDTESDTEETHAGARKPVVLKWLAPWRADAASKKAAAAASTTKPRASSSAPAIAASTPASSSAAAAPTPAPAAPSLPAIQHSMSASGRPIFWCRCDCKHRCAHLHAEQSSAANASASKDLSYESVLRPLFEPAPSSASDASTLSELRVLGSTLLPGLRSLFESTGVSVAELRRMPQALLHKCVCQVAHAHSTATYSVLLRHYPSPSALPRHS